MEITNQNSLQFLGVNIVKLEFNFDPSFYSRDSIVIETDFAPKCIINKSNLYEFIIEMEVKIFSENDFDIKFTALGNFIIHSAEEPTEILLTKYINANATAIMFPYIRSFVTTFTSNVGVFPSPLILPVKFFNGEMPIIERENSTKNENGKALNV